MIETMLQRYPITDAESHYQALREVMQVDFQQAREDVARFIKHPERLEIWSQGYFQGLVERLG